MRERRIAAESKGGRRREIRVETEARKKGIRTKED